MPEEEGSLLRSKILTGGRVTYGFGLAVQGIEIVTRYVFASYACTPPKRALWAVMPLWASRS